MVKPRCPFSVFLFTPDLLGAGQCCCGDNLPSHCQGRSVQEQRRSWFTDGQCYFNVYQHPVHHDHGKGMYNNHLIFMRFTILYQGALFCQIDR